MDAEPPWRRILSQAPRAARRDMVLKKKTAATRMPDVQDPVTAGYGLGRESVEEAIAAIAAGKVVVVTDDADRENEGDLIFAAEAVTAATMAFVVRHTSGVVCVAMPGDRLDELQLYPMLQRNEDPKETAFTVTVDRRGHGVTTGISASDRANTIRWLANPTSVAADFCRPGHIFPLRARPGGVLERDGHTEAAVDLARLAGLYPAGGLCEIVRDSDGEMSRADDLDRFAVDHGLVRTTIADLRQYIRDLDPERRGAFAAPTPTPDITLGPATRMPTSSGDFDAICCLEGTTEHLALFRGIEAKSLPRPTKAAGARSQAPAPPSSSLTTTTTTTKPKLAPLVRVHSECATGDLFGSRRCDCGEQLERALREIGESENGVLLYVRGHEGRGIGLGSKLRAYALQDAGRDTIEANTDQGLPVDARSYVAAAKILLKLGLSEVRLMTNNPAKCAELAANGVTVVERVPLVTTPNEVNFKYLLTKQRKMGHVLNLPDEYIAKEPHND